MKYIIYIFMFLFLLSSAYAVQCDYTPSIYEFLDTAETGVITNKWNNVGVSTYSSVWAKYGSQSIRTVSESITMSTPVFNESNTLITWVNVSYSPLVDIRRWIYIKDGATVHCAMGFRGSSKLQIGTGTFFNRDSTWSVDPYKEFQLMIQVNETPSCTYFARNSTDDDWTYLGFDNVASNHFDTISITNEGGASGSEVVFWDNVGVFNSTNPLSCIEIVIPITNSSWNVTSNNVVNTPSTNWNIGEAINVSSDLLSFTVETNINSNMSCRLGIEGNYSENIAYNPLTKATTTETTSHSLTLFESLSEGANTLYCGFINDVGEVEYPSGESHSGALLINYEIPVIPLVVELLTPLNNSVSPSPISYSFNTSTVGNCSVLINGSSVESFINVNGTESGSTALSIGDYNIYVGCGTVNSSVHLFSVNESVAQPLLSTDWGSCPDSVTSALVLGLVVVIAIFFFLVGVFLQIPVLVILSGLVFLGLGFVFISCYTLLGVLIIVCGLALLVFSSVMVFRAT